MSDKMTIEETINRLQSMIQSKRFIEHNYDGVVDEDACERAIELLKEQEAVEPKQVDLYGKDDWYGLVCVCPDCKAEWMSGKDDTHFCPNCGQAVKWE